MTRTYPLELKGSLFFIDNSTLSTICSCPRKGAYSALARRQVSLPRDALFFGGAIHKALEVRDLEQQVLCTQTIEEKMIDALVEYFASHETDNYRNLSYAITTIEKYNLAHPADAQVAIELPSGEVAVELPFALPMGTVDINRPVWITDPDIDSGKPQLRVPGTITIVFTGKIDRICEKNGNLWLLDHKTTSMGGPTFFDEFYTSHQFRGYKWAAQQLLDRPIAGVIINALICRPPLKSGNINHTFDRQDILIDDDQVTEWQHSFLQIIEQFLHTQATQTDHPESPELAFPMHTNSCISKYGKCEFFQVCQLTPKHRAAMLWSQLYEDNTWTPLEEKAKPEPKPEPAFPGLFTSLG